MISQHVNFTKNSQMTKKWLSFSAKIYFEITNNLHTETPVRMCGPSILLQNTDRRPVSGPLLLCKSTTAVPG
jgi:hypothetical protein